MQNHQNPSPTTTINQITALHITCDHVVPLKTTKTRHISPLTTYQQLIKSIKYYCDNYANILYPIIVNGPI